MKKVVKVICPLPSVCRCPKCMIIIIRGQSHSAALVGKHLVISAQANHFKHANAFSAEDTYLADFGLLKFMTCQSACRFWSSYMKLAVSSMASWVESLRILTGKLNVSCHSTAATPWEESSPDLALHYKRNGRPVAVCSVECLDSLKHRCQRYTNSTRSAASQSGVDSAWVEPQCCLSCALCSFCDDSAAPMEI